MRREEYEEAKRKNADWDKEASADIRTWSKLYIFDSILSKREYKKVIETISKRIESFVSLIDEKEIADRYRSDLTEYAQKTYEWVQEHFGRFTPAVLAMALSDKSTLTKAQIKVVEEKGAAALTFSGAVDTRFLQKPGRDYAYTQGTAAYGYFEDVHREVKKAMADFEALEIKPKYYANVNPRNIAEMLVRFNAYKKKKKELIDKGVELVLVPSHANCSKRCQPYQGRVYSLNGTTGSIDGRRYVPIEEAADNVTYTSKNTGKTYYAGLFAYNCRHDLVEYKRGMNIERIPADVIERRREVEAEQRVMERNYRMLREKSELYYLMYKKSKNPEMQKIARKAQLRAQKIKKKYIAYSEENDIAYFPTRLRILAGENRYVRTKGKKDAIAKEALRMKEEQENEA